MRDDMRDAVYWVFLRWCILPDENWHSVKTETICLLTTTCLLQYVCWYTCVRAIIMIFTGSDEIHTLPGFKSRRPQIHLYYRPNLDYIWVFGNIWVNLLLHPSSLPPQSLPCLSPFRIFRYDILITNPGPPPNSLTIHWTPFQALTSFFTFILNTPNVPRRKAWLWKKNWKIYDGRVKKFDGNRNPPCRTWWIVCEGTCAILSSYMTGFTFIYGTVYTVISLVTAIPEKGQILPRRIWLTNVS